MYRPRARRPRPAGDGEAGFALVEVMVSAVLLIVLALAMLPVLDISASRAGTNRSRSVAANLAKSEQQRLRSLDVSASLSNYRGTQTQTVAGVDYVVSSRADWVRDDSGTVSCTTDSDAVQYLKLTTTVTWPQMNGTQPVTEESLLSPPVGEFGTDVGTLVVQVSKGNGDPAPGLTVSAAGVSDVTNSLGCVVFANVPAGSTTVNLSSPGFVTPTGAPTVSDPTSVVARQTTLVSEQYDAAGTVPVSFDTRSFSAPTVRAAQWRTVTASHSALLTPRLFGNLTDPLSSQIAATPLFPFPSGYTVYAGSCAGNDPSTYQANYFASNPGLVTVPPGTTTAPVTVRVPTITVGVQRFKSGTSGAVENPQTDPTKVFQPHIVISPGTATAMNGCSERYSPPTSGAAVFSGTLGGTSFTGMRKDVQVPFGSWQVCVDDGRHKQTATVNATGSGGINGVEQKIVVPGTNVSGTSVCT
jgi:Tfp pilus assembly protein PilV